MLVYMLLTETFDVSDCTLRQQLDVPVLSEDLGGTSSRTTALKTVEDNQ